MTLIGLHSWALLNDGKGQEFVFENNEYKGTCNSILDAKIRQRNTKV